ncbi:TIGR03086 family metal-binding protein [Nocardioides marmorisolisilvae]|uniref:TIGR03086 family protein n=1 Tax=Nocardioides marmorisolisilvae TaxID=1542737 RepID=A0A3N0DWU4_9ACTN|nr:TIGR03086 family metal-binding protein [Nocardioides marmorisolisilvae]RNL79913.1 TIGR03086 family protein [Nocardioides marmorisolisilvae]
MDPLDLYTRASDWTLDQVSVAATDLDAPTPCAGWDVRTLMNHLLQTQAYFAGAAAGRDGTPPGQEPPALLTDDPTADFVRARREVLQAFSGDGVVEKTGPLLAIAFADQLVHGWDLARAAGQGATMPPDLAEAAYEAIHGRFTDEQRAGTFGPELPVADDASFQDRLLAYTGREPG